MKKYIVIISILVITSLLVFVLTNKTKGEEYFKSVTLSDDNLITNNLLPAFYDTILSVGLDQHGIKGTHVIISELTEAAKDNFTYGELKAHLRYYNGDFYLFIDKLNRRQSIDVICHEIIHIEQYLTGDFVFDGEKTFWFGQEYDYGDSEYDLRPWETDAFDREPILASKVYEILIGY